MTRTTKPVRAGGLAAVLLAGALVTGACGGGGHSGTRSAPSVTTVPVAGSQTAAIAPGPDVDAELKAVDDGLQRLDGDLTDTDTGLSTDEGDPSR